MKTKYRIAECLLNGGTNYAKVRKCAIVEEPHKDIREIKVDENGNEYFTLTYNPYYDKDKMKLSAKIFSGRIGDAVQCIKDGYADAVSVGNNANIFSTGISVYVFLDRNIGDEYRNKTIEGWKDTKFGYVISFGGVNSFSCFNQVDENGNCVSAFGWMKVDDRKAKVYDTYEEAEAAVKQYIQTAKEYADKYKSAESKEEKMSICNETFKCNIVDSFFWDFVEHGKLEEIGYNIDQEVKK